VYTSYAVPADFALLKHFPSGPLSYVNQAQPHLKLLKRLNALGLSIFLPRDGKMGTKTF